MEQIAASLTQARQWQRHISLTPTTPTLEQSLSVSHTNDTDSPAATTVAPAAIITINAATVVSTTLASAAGAALGGDVMSAASLVLLSMLSCTTFGVDPGASVYVMSVFFDQGPVSMVIGNIGLCVFVFLCQFAIVTAVARLQQQTSSRLDVEVKLRFPAVAVRIIDFLMPGTMFSAFLCFWSQSSGASGIVVGVFGVAAVATVVSLELLYSTRFVIPTCRFERHKDLHHQRSSSAAPDNIEKKDLKDTPNCRGLLWPLKLLHPVGQGQPMQARNRFSPFIGLFVDGRTSVRLITSSRLRM